MWDDQALTTNPTPFTTSGAGAIPVVATNPASFIVPSSQFGAHTVRVSTSATNFQIATFTINTPAIVVTSPAVPAAGLPVGINITVTGTNFESKKLTIIYFDDVSSATITTTYNGAFEVSLPIPDVNNTGAHILKAQNSTYAVTNITVVVATPAIALTPTTAPAGLNVTVTGTNFKVNSPVSFLINGDTLIMDSTVVTNGAGSFAATFSVPDLVQGANTVKAISYTQLYAVATLTLGTPAITISPATGTPGLNISITGTNFKANAPVNLYVNGVTVAEFPVITANSAGSFVATFQAPELIQGANTFKAESYTNYYATATYTVSTPAITISPTTGPAGFVATVIGTNFKANAAVSLYMNGVALSPISAITANSAGSFVANVVIPDLMLGANVIKAQSYDNFYATTTYTVSTPAITVTPSGATTAPVSSGLPVNIMGTNFKSSAPINVYVNNIEVTPTIGAVTANSNGEFGCVIIFPQVPAGISTLKVQSYDGLFAATTLTVSASAIAVSPTSGPAGSLIFVNGSGFESKATVAFYFNGNSTTETTTTNSVGAFTAQITVPQNTPAGAYTLRAQTNSINFANTAFTVTASSVTVSPTSGSPGTKIILSGSNFDPNASLTFKWGGRKITAIERSVVTTGDLGTFYATFNIPTDATIGSNQIEVSTSTTNTAFTYFTVSTPSLTLSLSSGSPGAKVTITGANFSGNQAIYLTWDDGAIVSSPASITSTSSGSFTAVVTIPKSNRGTHYLKAAGGQQKLVASAQFTVNAPTLTLDTTTSQPSMKIKVNGTSFTPSTIVTFSWDNNLVSSLVDSVVTTDTAGSFATTVTLPSNASSGIHTLQANTSEDVFATIQITVTTGVLSISSDTLNLGTNLTLSGMQFDANKLVKLYLDGTEISDVEITTDGIGGFTYQYTLTDSIKVGEHTFGAKTSEYVTSEVKFSINQPELYINPEKALTGSVLSIRGSRFTPNSEVVIYSNGKKIKTVQTDANGNFMSSAKTPMVLGAFTLSAASGDSDHTSVEIPVQLSFGYLLVILLLLILITGCVLYFLRKKRRQKNSEFKEKTTAETKFEQLSETKKEEPTNSESSEIKSVE